MDATLPQGSTHMFVCAASAIPFPFFVFRFNGERITFNSSERTVITTDTHATLTLFNLQGTDEGTYNCSVSNRFGSVSTAAVLTVQGVLGLGVGGGGVGYIGKCVRMYSMYVRTCVVTLWRERATVGTW